MKPGNVVLIRLPQIGGGPPKLRPALVLTPLPGPFQNVLICGISTQMRGLERDWDEVIDERDLDFRRSGLRRASAIRLSYLYSAEEEEIAGTLGQIEDPRLRRLSGRLARLLTGASHAPES